MTRPPPLNVAIEQRYAELIVRVGANVGEGQYVLVDGLIEHAPLARAIAEEAYSAGAVFVDVRYADVHIRRAMIEKGPDSALRFTPAWMVERLASAGRDAAAQILIVGNTDPALFAGLDEARVGRAQQVAFNEAHMKNIATRAINWTIAAYPSATWANMVFGEPDVARLWHDVIAALRLDEPDPVAAWETHMRTLDRRAHVLNEARFDAIRFKGDGTDLEVGLLPASRWVSAAAETAFGRRHIVNLPTEEVFTTPDRTRASGVVRATTDLVFPGKIVRGLELRFEGGKIAEVQAEEGAEYVRAELATDDGACRLGEIALVDGTSRVGQAGHPFFNGLFDENATAHIAYGQGFPYCVDGATSLDQSGQLRVGVNQSSIHTDVMVGSLDVKIYGVSKRGMEVPIIIGGEWQLG